MNKRIACSVFLACLASHALADQTTSRMGVLSYLHPAGFGLLGGATGQLRLTVPNDDGDLTVDSIVVTTYTSQDGGCGGQLIGSCPMDGGSEVTLVHGHTYSTTDLSNISLFDSCRSWSPTSDDLYQLQYENSDVGLPFCANGGQGDLICSGDTCGWTTDQNWTWAAS